MAYFLQEIHHSVIIVVCEDTTSIKLRKNAIFAAHFKHKHMTISEKILRDLRRFVDEVSANSSSYHMKVTNFTRKGKLSFSNIVLLISSLLKKVYNWKSIRFLTT
jgi:hypothetical protein